MIAKEQLRKGSTIETRRRIKPWGPFGFGAIPIGATGVVALTYTNIYPVIKGKPRRISFAIVDFRWEDARRKPKHSTVTISIEPEDRKNFKIVNSHAPNKAAQISNKERNPVISRQNIRITPKKPRIT